MKNHFTKISGKQKRAETLVEVIMAIFIILIGSGAATVLIVSSMQANTFNKDNLVGMNLAVEGMEAVRIIRDTNWIKFSYDKANCWNMHPDTTVGDNCLDPNNIIAADNYTINLNPTNYSWTLTSEGIPLDLKNLDAASNENYRMVFIDTDDGFDSNSNGVLTDDTDLMVSKEGANLAFTQALMPETGQTRFYRMITISYPNAPDMDIMNVESLVQWRTSSAVVHQVKLSSSLTNFNRVKVN